jgi:hypothetical protein
VALSLSLYGVYSQIALFFKVERTSNISTSFLILFLIEKSGFVVSASVFFFLFLFFFFSIFWGAKFHTIANSIFLGKKKIFKFRFEKNLKKSPFFNKELGILEFFTFLV